MGRQGVSPLSLIPNVCFPFFNLSYSQQTLSQWHLRKNKQQGFHGVGNGVALWKRERLAISREGSICSLSALEVFIPPHVHSCPDSYLSGQDDSSPDPEIWIQLSSLPVYGALLRTSGSEVEELSVLSNFTMEDINNKNIRYITIWHYLMAF